MRTIRLKQTTDESHVDLDVGALVVNQLEHSLCNLVLERRPAFLAPDNERELVWRGECKQEEFTHNSTSYRDRLADLDALNGLIAVTGDPKTMEVGKDFTNR